MYHKPHSRSKKYLRVDVSKYRTKSEFRGNSQIFDFAYIRKFVMSIGPMNHGIHNLFKYFCLFGKIAKNDFRL